MKECGRGPVPYLPLAPNPLLPGKRLSWIVGGDVLDRILGLRPAEAMNYVGFSLTWMRARLRDGTRHKLVVRDLETS